MSKEYNSALQARVEQFLKEKNISQAKAAPLMGISQTALSQYRRSMYDNGDISALESKLEEFFRTQEEQEASTEKALPYRPTQDYIPTSISEDVYKLHPQTAARCPLTARSFPADRHSPALSHLLFLPRSFASLRMTDDRRENSVTPAADRRQ